MPSRTVHLSENGMRLDRFMRIHFPDVPFGMVSSLTRRGKLTVDDCAAQADQSLKAGQVVSIAHREKQPKAADPSKMRARHEALSDADRSFVQGMLLYEDEDIFIFDKPSGLAVHPGSKITRDLDSLLVRYVSSVVERPVLAHRLDKDTSGVLVAAKRKDIAQALGKAFAGRDVEKEYRAIVSGKPTSDIIDIAIAKKDTPKGGRMVAVDPKAPDALSALTRVSIVATSPAATHVALFPETGRQHQLRVHMALVGHPILGDALYGDPASAPRLMLHAYRLRFKHPSRGWMNIEAPLPQGFEDL